MDWKIVGIVALVIIAIIIGCVFMIQGAQNNAISLEEQIEAAKSDIEIQEKRRVDLVYNLADCVIKYDEHEAHILTTIAKSREKIEDSANLTTKLDALAEAYPELKSDVNYREFMNELSMTENLIAQHRSNYNHQVKNYNRHVRKFPTRQFLDMTGYEVLNYEYLEFNAPSDAPQNLFKGR